MREISLNTLTSKRSSARNRLLCGLSSNHPIETGLAGAEAALALELHFGEVVLLPLADFIGVHYVFAAADPREVLLLAGVEGGPVVAAVRAL